MPDEYRLSYLPLFYEELENTVRYIAETLGSPTVAMNLVDKVEEAILKRKTCAESFEPYHSLRDRALPYYRIYVDNYVVYYVVIREADGSKTMEVRRFLYGGQNRMEIV